ncbi:MAG: HPr family phosphocarrier protein [Planctomycetota bacterium]
MATRHATVSNDEGLHARPAELVARTAMAHAAEVTLVRGEHRVDAKSILDLLTLGAAKGVELVIEATGDDAEQAADAVAELINRGFDSNAV